MEKTKLTENGFDVSIILEDIVWKDLLDRDILLSSIPNDELKSIFDVIRNTDRTTINGYSKPYLELHLGEELSKRKNELENLRADRMFRRVLNAERLVDQLFMPLVVKAVNTKKPMNEPLSVS